jgi:hypothetical protein
MYLEDLRELTTPRGQRLNDEQRSELGARLDEEGNVAKELHSYQLDEELDERGIVVAAKAVSAFRLGENELVVVTRPFRHEPEREREASTAYATFAERWKSDTYPKARDAYGLDQEMELMSFQQFWGSGRDDMRRERCDGAWKGYSSPEEALQDVFRIVLGLVLDGPASSVKEAAGWERDIVLLVRGMDFYTITTRANRWGEERQLDVDRDEKAFWATVSYARRLMELARREYDGIGSLADGGDLRASWLAREGAGVLLDQARHATKMGVALYAMNGSMSELALKLHTDRANLYRLLPAGMKRRVR